TNVNHAFVNQGTSTRAGAGDTRFDVAFNNQGSVAVNAVNLWLNAGGSDSGNFQVSAGTGLVLGGTTALTAGSGVSGAGAVYFVGGTATLDGTLYAITGGTWAAGGIANFLSTATVQAVGPPALPRGPLHLRRSEALPTRPPS